MTAPHTTDKVGEALAEGIAKTVAEQCHGDRKPGASAQRYATIFQAARLGALAALASSRAEGEGLAWLTQNTHAALDYYSPVYGDDDDQSREWRVTLEGGNINDREWTIIGRGETPLAALLAARHHDSGVVGSPVQPEGATDDGERQAALEVRARAMVRQLEVVLHWLNGQAYSSTLSELNALKAALPPQPEGVKR